MIKILTMMLACLMPFAATAESIEECQQLAADNYPLVKRYSLIKQTERLTLSNIAKDWLPKIEAYAQGSYQSAVPELPELLKSILASQGQDAKGISALQYRAGINIQQTLYDGGAASAERAVERSRSNADVTRNAVDIYALRQRVNEIYFGWLLAEEHLRLNGEKIRLLKSSADKLAALYNKGVAMGCDVDAVNAELASARQQTLEITATRDCLQKTLSLLCGKEVTSVTKPSAETPAGKGIRPELQLFDSQLSLNAAREKALNAALRPRIGLFAQGYYGYMGYDMFRDMFERTPSLNALAGAKITWNISSLQTNRNDRRKLQAQRDDIEVARETFLFNQRMEETQEQKNIDLKRKLMAEDDEIVALRKRIRMAAEAKLAGGIIDTDNLIQEISRENRAAINRSLHEVEYLKALYELRRIEGE